MDGIASITAFKSGMCPQPGFPKSVCVYLYACLYDCLYNYMFVFLHPREQNFIKQKQPVCKN